MISRPEAVSQIIMVSSELPAAMRCPSGENATHPTKSLCPVNVPVSERVFTSQSFKFFPAEVTMRLPSGDQATADNDLPSGPAMENSSIPFLLSQIVAK